MAGITTGQLLLTGATLLSGSKSRKSARRSSAASLEFQREQAALLEEQKERYRQIEFVNPYANMENAYAGLQTDFSNLAAGTRNVYAGAQNMYAGMENLYEGMENRFEDLTVDTRAADFQARQGAQQRANIMQGLRGAAGTSGIAGLAQSLANQGAMQSQQIAAGIGQQERQNQMLAAQEGSRIDMAQRGAGMQLQQLQASGAMQTQQMRMAGAAQQQQMILAGAGQAQALGIARENLIAQGASAADMAQRGGEAMLQEAEMSRQATLLGVGLGQSAGANQAYQQNLMNQQYANLSANQMTNTALTNLIKDIDWGGGGLPQGHYDDATQTTYDPSLTY